jgi:hypothetical protein
VCVRCAKCSVWPQKAMPASCITLFCTGPVTSAANAPVAQASAPRSRVASTARALTGSGAPGVTGAVSGACQTSMAPSGGPSACGSNGA